VGVEDVQATAPMELPNATGLPTFFSVPITVLL
jgi:hypothetical protein